LVNMGPVPFEVGVGDRIAQLILEKAEQHARVVQVPSLADLGVSARGNNGFGSTGV
jgi:dUTPase